MNRDDIIRMAREADLNVHDPAIDLLQRFAALVYAEGHKDGVDDSEAVVLPTAIKAEREAIAQSLDKQADLAADEIDRQWAQEMAAAIRARGQG